MASYPSDMMPSSELRSSETTPYDSSSLTDERANMINGKHGPLSQDPDNFCKAKSDTPGGSDLEGGNLPALNTTVSRTATISKKRAYTLMILIVLTQAVQMFAHGVGIIGAFTVGHTVGASDLQSTWIAAAYPLTQGSFVLISGRLDTVFGHKKMLTLGSTIWIFWTFATAYGDQHRRHQHHESARRNRRWSALMNVLIATMPAHQTYWAMVFPAIVLAGCTGDMVFAAGQIIASSIVTRKHQGIAGPLIGTLSTYGLSTGLGFAGTVEIYINKDRTDLLEAIEGLRI